MLSETSQFECDVPMMWSVQNRKICGDRRLAWGVGGDD